ncbi:hypothetical protein BCR36DRAFT_413021 [Piromyces finnis]|uniref:Uncharacterized protein n=1 Tax=Piromyces finnis TaxID=1754191 RepID=A0A1Y1V7C4_9FUNG|nr:hypothetical protein BCR36DRAFT_413021 [Piromyces finnis]|eukprot:ORX49026.1 hypothetical protein BCR36DRAFT_413021 [Piromyces finnis]
MNVIKFILLFSLIFKTFCSIHNTAAEEFALLILAAADDDGNVDSFGLNNLGSLLDDIADSTVVEINVSTTGTPLMLNIKDIVPNLRNGQITFSELHRLAENIYNAHFPQGQNPIDIINNYDIINYLTTPVNNNAGNNNAGNNNNAESIKMLDGSMSKEIFYPPIINQNNRIFNYIRNHNVNQLIHPNVNAQGNAQPNLQILAQSIDINNPNNQYTTSSQSPAYVNRERLFRAITAQCIKSYSTCKDKYFTQNHNTNDINFYIVTSTDNNGITRHSFIIDDSLNHKLAHPFTLKETNNNNDITYVEDNSYSSTEITYNDIVNRNNGYQKLYTPNDVTQNGIGLISKIGTEIDNNGHLYQPNQYYINDNKLNQNALSARIASNTLINSKR